MLVYIVVLIIVGSSWFILQMANGNYDIIKDFITYQIRLFTTEDAGHGGFFLYHVVILFIGVFPASIFALPTLFGSILELYRSKSMGLWMRILFWVVLILFSIVDTKIVHYSSLAYFPLTFLASKLIYRIIQEKRVFRKYQKTLLIIVSFVFSAAVILITIIGKYKDKLPLEKWFASDPFALANLQADVHWTGFEMLIGIIYFSVFLFIMFGTKKSLPRIVGLFAVTIFFTYATILFITPRIEGYTQRAAIEFYEELEDDDVYLATLGFKSYAHLYYSRMQPGDSRASDSQWLLEGEIDKPAYFVFKIHHEERYLDKYPQLEKLYDKNGFVFAKRIVND